MLHFLYDLSQTVDAVDFLRVFGSTALRSGGAFITALVMCLLIGPPIIRRLKAKYAEGQPIRDVGPDHQGKRGTPTMGGLMILASLTTSCLLWMDLTLAHTWMVLMVTLGFGAVGFLDDYRKLTRNSYRGAPAKVRLALKGAIVLVAAIWLAYVSPEALNTAIAFPFFKDFLLDGGYLLYVPFVIIVVVGAGNAVNLTDGLDGLATVPVMIAATSFGVIAYVVGRPDWSKDLLLFNVPNAEELLIFCAGLCGACLGFLWYNAPPARVFMGDTGSLALGGALGIIAVITKHEFVLAIIGGLFVLEAASVVIQVISFKTTGKRVFRMAPIHHHFEKKGWAEPTIVIRFWIISVVLALIGLATLKLR